MSDETTALATALMEECGLERRNVGLFENLIVPVRKPLAEPKLPGIDYALSGSALKVFRESVPRFAGLYVHKTIDWKPASDAMEFGTLFHCVLLEPDSLTKKFAAAPECTKQGDKNKATWAAAEQAAKANNQILVKRDDLIKALRMSDAVRANPDCRELLEHPGKVEFRLGASKRPAKPDDPPVVEHDFLGLLLQARYDKLLDDGSHLEVKTDQNPYEFGKSLTNFWYYGQGAFQRMVAEYAGLSGECHYLIVGKEEPYESCVQRLSRRDLEMGRQEVEALLSELHERLRSGDWSSRLGSQRETCQPYWAYKRG